MGRTRVKKADGSCCACSDQTNCECADTAPCVLICRSKSGIAELCGFDEYTDPSDPPKRYRTRTLSGMAGRNIWGGTNNCTGTDTSTDDCSFSGSCTYNRDTCELSAGGASICDPSGAATGICSVGSNCCYVMSLTSTTRSFSINESCCEFVGFSAIGNSAGQREDLSDEDTEEDALARIVTPMDWTGCESCLLCPAFKTMRGSADTEFAFRETQVRVNLTSLIVGHSYHINIRYYRRLLGSSGPWLFLTLDEVTLTPGTDEEAASILSGWFDVPNEAGFETRAQSCDTTDVTL